MYNNIFAVTYQYYSRFKNESPRFSAVCVVLVCQLVLVFLMLILLKKANIIDAFGTLPSKFYILPFLAIWLYLIQRFYSKEKASQVLAAFDKKTSSQKKVWGVIALANFILPIIIIAFLLKK
jgi:hypothetical protein